jgi:hypothetical protein
LQLYTELFNKFATQLAKKVVMLTGETGTDLKLLAKVSIVLCLCSSFCALFKASLFLV